MRAEPEPAECPKCGHRQRGGHACHRCGLDFAKVARGEARLPEDPLAQHPGADEIRARWAALARSLDDVEGHHAFIRTCARLGLLDYAGHCYRRLTPAGQAEDPRVAAYRERVLRAALATVPRLEPRRPPVYSDRLRRLLVLTFGALFLLAGAIGYYLLVHLADRRQFPVDGP